MKEFWKYVIAAGVYAALVGTVLACCLVFGPFALAVIPAIAILVIASLLAIAAIKENIVDPIGRRVFHSHGRRWTL